MSKVFFKPWIGKNYLTHGYNGIKIFLLGESHYCGDCLAPCPDYFSEKCKNKTINIVEDFLNYKKGIVDHKSYMATYTRFTDIFIGKKISNNELIDFWNSIVFYCYVQIAMDTPRQEPSMEDFETGDEAFVEVMRELQPDVIIVWGNRFWEKRPESFSKGNKDFLDRQGRPLNYYSCNGKKIPAMGIYHPSSRYFTYEDSPKFMELLEKIAQQ
jgi:hypothetical protein